MKHGTESYLIKGEGLVVGRLFSLSLLHWVFSRFYNLIASETKVVSYPDYSDNDEVTEPTRIFCRLFKKGDQFDGASLIELGQVMETEAAHHQDDCDGTIPAGYTYLGQFIDHDITLDRENILGSMDTVSLENMINFRSPALDLDSVFLGGAEKNPELYEKDGKSLKIGQTSDTMGLGVFDNDLPRKEIQAVIGDSRNDENLIVAQTHLAFMKFHNSCIVKNPTASFEEIRQEVVLHYQSIILTDFLPKIVDKSILSDVLQNGRRVYTDQFNDCMPLEFSVAAFRMGHSMLRPAYEWNCIFNSEGALGMATFQQISEHSGVSGKCGARDSCFYGMSSLPSNWIPDWRRFYDLSAAGGERHQQLNFARKIDSALAIDLKVLPEFQQMSPQLPAPLLSLSTRNLLRGRLVCLPTGQQVAAILGVTPLTSLEIINNVSPDQAKILVERGFDQATPLWYYILREAMLQANGNHLGAVGSHIVCETFIGLIENSPTNVLSERPDLQFSMAEMLMSMPELINPLGNG